MGVCVCVCVCAWGGGGGRSPWPQTFARAARASRASRASRTAPRGLCGSHREAVWQPQRSGPGRFGSTFRPEFKNQGFDVIFDSTNHHFFVENVQKSTKNSNGPHTGQPEVVCGARPETPGPRPETPGPRPKVAVLIDAAAVAVVPIDAVSSSSSSSSSRSRKGFSSSNVGSSKGFSSRGRGRGSSSNVGSSSDFAGCVRSMRWAAAKPPRS